MLRKTHKFEEIKTSGLKIFHEFINIILVLKRIFFPKLVIIEFVLLLLLQLFLLLLLFPYLLLNLVLLFVIEVV